MSLTPQASRAPVFFISHGAPTFALEPGVLGPRLQALGQSLTADQSLKAVLVVSPHWQTRDVQVSTTARPETIYDFGGFPAALYRLQYPAAGHPALAQETGRVLAAAGLTVSFDAQRGLDHGAWVPLYHLLPQADVPVFQVSMPHRLDTASALALGRALAPLREQGVAIVASGSMTHNLDEFRQSGAREEPYAAEFTQWVRRAVTSSHVNDVVHYRELAPHAERAHPSEEHFLPLLVALGALGDDEPAHVVDAGITHSVLSMESYAWGLN